MNEYWFLQIGCRYVEIRKLIAFKDTFDEASFEKAFYGFNFKYDDVIKVSSAVDRTLSMKLTSNRLSITQAYY